MIPKQYIRYPLIILLLISGLGLGMKWVDQDVESKGLPYSPGFMMDDQDSNGIFIIEVSAKRIDFLNLSNGKLMQGQRFEKTPTGFADSGDLLVVTCENGDGEVLLIDKKSLKTETRFDVGAGARSPVIVAKRKLLTVCHTWSNELGVFAYPSGELIKNIPVLRQPFVSVLSLDEKYLFVANFITHQRADMDTVSSAISVINLETLEVEKNLLLANGSNALRGMTLSSDGDYVLISHNLGRFQVPTTQLEQGWMNTSALSVIQVSTLSYEGTVLLDEPEYGAAGSWGVACDSGLMVVAHSGTHDISLIREEKFFEKLEETQNRDVLSYDLNFLGNIRERVRIPGNGPRAVIINGSDVYAAMYFSDTVNHIRITEGKYEVNSLPLNSGFYEDQVRLGEKYFNDAHYCFQGWQSCNGCHPLDARTDGLNWDLLNDGIGNPKNCKSMLLTHFTPPTMITGIRADAKIAVRAGFRYIQFAQVPEENSQAVDAYLMSLKPVPSPFLSGGELTERARKGKELYSQLGCLICHPLPYYTDLKMHTFVSPNDTLGEQGWDTPTLVEVWRTGPWMHDGRCATMREVFTSEKHGVNRELIEDELNDLVEYVLSL